MGLNDNAWEQLFNKLNILGEIEQNGKFVISANQIREYREPRLMCKFDHSVNRPKIFVDNDLSILPISRGEYVISSFSAYHSFENTVPAVEKIKIPDYLKSLEPQFIVSEAIALNCANACGILTDFLEDEEIVPTVNGRMGSGLFGFEIDTTFGRQYVGVFNSQIEIDAAYEGINYLSLFEAKKDLSEDFLIRQLYYPFRAWNQRIDKPIKSVFMTFSNGQFSFYEYKFLDGNNYNSLQLVKQKNYVISTGISLQDIMSVMHRMVIIAEPEISFPQADNMSRIINLVELLYDRDMTKSEITAEYAFDERQTNYYTDAGRYLNLIEKYTDEDGNITFKLTPNAKATMRKPFEQRQMDFVYRILSHKPFYEVMKIHLKTGQMPVRSEIIGIMKKSRIYNVSSESTFYRRASTVMRWTEWILELIED